MKFNGRTSQGRPRGTWQVQVNLILQVVSIVGITEEYVGMNVANSFVRQESLLWRSILPPAPAGNGMMVGK